MSEREWNSINTAERQIVERHLRNIPVRLGRLANELGIHVKLSSLPSDCSGLIQRSEQGYEIKINRHESRERQRFTLAHEISHYLLHRHIIDRNIHGIRDNVLYRSGEPQNIEYEANRLAADIIMPKSQLIQNLSKFNSIVSEDVIELLAKNFGVSKAAMEIRITGLDTQIAA